MERKRRALVVAALATSFGAVVCIMLVHGVFPRVAVGASAALVLVVIAAAGNKALSPFTMENATRPRNTGMLSARAEREDDEVRELVETEMVAAKTESARDESER